MSMSERRTAVFYITGIKVMEAVFLTVLIVLFGIGGYLLGGIVLGLLSFIPFEIGVMICVYESYFDELEDLYKRAF